MSRETAVQAFYLDEFLKTEHQYADNIDETTRRVIRHLVSNNLRPPEISKGKGKGKGKGVSSEPSGRQRTRSHSVEPLPFPSDWAIDRSALTTALLQFEEATQALRPAAASLLSEPQASLLDFEAATQSSDPRASAAANLPASTLDNSPPSTGNTPPHSTSHSASGRDSTRATSAEEGIWKEPFGPRNRNVNDAEMSGHQRRHSASPNEEVPEWQQTGFTQQQWAALQRLMRPTQTPPPPGPQGPPGPTGPTGPPGADGYSSSGTPNWNAKDIGFFDPHLDKSYGDGDIVTQGSDVYYRNVMLFIERVKDLAAIKGAAVVRTNLNTCLRGNT